MMTGRSITKVHVESNGHTDAYSADIVVSACGAINSAALLLRSANDKHPHGLANGSGVVGRHYMGHISFVGKLDAETLQAGAPALTPGWTLDLMAKHSLDFWLTSEDLPDPNNRVTLDRHGNIVLTYKPNNEEGHRRLTAKLKSLMQQQTKCAVHGHTCHEGLLARNLFVGQRIPLAGVAHQTGTIRFGHDPQTSALDALCKAHEVDNLYVVDASFFPSSGAVNLALTIMANALRVGDHLLERLQ